MPTGDPAVLRRALAGSVLAVLLAGCSPAGAPPELGTSREVVCDPHPQRGDTGSGQGGAAAADGEGVLIAPRDDWQAIVDAHPPGTTFRIGAGTHRMAQVVARDGDSFIGEDGAVMVGSSVVQGFRRDGQVWVAAAPELSTAVTGDLDEGFELEGRRHDLYLDGAFLRQVERGRVGPGSWHYDADGGEIVMGEDPDGHTVEVGRTRHAIEGAGAADVTIRGLTVLRYSPPSQRGAIDAADSPGWVVEDVEVRASHGAAIRVGPGIQIRRSTIADNGQIGITGAVDLIDPEPVRIVGNDICGNGRLGFTWFWEKGGIKLVGSADAELRDNVVHDNLGPGIWMDIVNTDTRMIDNVVVDNAIIGVLFELSDGLLLEGNQIRGNGWDAPAEIAAGLSVSNGDQVLARANTFSDNTNEILITRSERERMGPRLTGIEVTGNDITIAGGAVGVSIRTDERDLYDPGVIRFTDNRYRLDSCEPCFLWAGPVSSARWVELGLDAGSTLGSAS